MNLNCEEFLLRALERRALTPQAADALRARALGDALPGVAVRDGLLAIDTVAGLLAELEVRLPAIPGYRLLAPLGEGASGTVWLAEADGQRVALKLVRTQDAEDAARFVREAGALQAIDHPRVVRCLAVGANAGVPYLALELVAGGDADRLLRSDGRLSERRALELIRDAAEGLAAIHAAGLLHRDLKPANLMLDADGRAKVADFGLARTLDDRLTRTGAVIGTPAYMPPEQARGDAAIDQRCDIYALGATLFTLVTGQPPFRGRTPWEIVGKVAKEPAPDPRDLRPDLGGQIRAIIRCAMAHDPAARYQNADDLREDCVTAIAGGPPAHAAKRRAAVGASTIAPTPLPIEPPRQRRFPARSAIVAAVIVCGAILGWMTGRWWGAPPERELAERSSARRSGDLAVWRAYLRDHPQGDGADEARSMLALLDEITATELEAQARLANQQGHVREGDDLLSRKERLQRQIAEHRQAVAASPGSPPISTEALVEVMTPPVSPSPPSAVPLPTPTAPEPPPAESAARVLKPLKPPRTITATCEWIWIDGVDPQRMSILASGQLQVSTDGGRTFIVKDQRELFARVWPSSKSSKSSQGQVASAAKRSGALFTPLRSCQHNDGNPLGIWSGDGGLTVEAVRSPQPTMDAPSVVLLHDGSLACLATGTLYTSRDHGRTWKRTPCQVGPWDVLVPARAGLWLLAQDQEVGHPTRQRISVDSGQTWSVVPGGGFGFSCQIANRPQAFAESESQALLLTGGCEILCFSPSGTFRERIKADDLRTKLSLAPYAIAIHPQREDVWYIQMEHTILARSTDRGRTWFRLRPDITLDTRAIARKSRAFCPFMVRIYEGRVELLTSGPDGSLIAIDDHDVDSDLFPIRLMGDG